MTEGKEEIHINKANFCDTENHFWVVKYNESGIGTPLFDVNEDILFFTEQTRRDERKKFRDKYRFGGNRNRILERDNFFKYNKNTTREICRQCSRKYNDWYFSDISGYCEDCGCSTGHLGFTNQEKKELLEENDRK